MSLFGDDLTDDNVKFNNYRVYGTILLMCMGLVVFLGVKFVNRSATDIVCLYQSHSTFLNYRVGGVALLCVLCSIVSIYVGVFVNANGNDKAK